MVEELWKVVDVETMSTKQFIAALSSKCVGVDLGPKEKMIRAKLSDITESIEKEKATVEQEQERQEQVTRERAVQETREDLECMAIEAEEAGERATRECAQRDAVHVVEREVAEAEEARALH